MRSAWWCLTGTILYLFHANLSPFSSETLGQDIDDGWPEHCIPPKSSSFPINALIYSGLDHIGLGASTAAQVALTAASRSALRCLSTTFYKMLYTFKAKHVMSQPTHSAVFMLRVPACGCVSGNASGPSPKTVSKARPNLAGAADPATRWICCGSTLTTLPQCFVPLTLV